MPVRGRYTTILVDAFDLSGQSNNLAIQAATNQLEVTPFQSAAKQFITEPVEGSMTHGGYFNGGLAGEIEKVLYDRLGTGSAYVTALLNTAVTACPAYVCPATQGSQFQIQSTPVGIITLNAQWMAGSGMLRGIRVHGSQVLATGPQPYIDLGAIGTNGYAILHATSSGGTATNAQVAVKSDDNTGFATPTTHGTFTYSGEGAALMTITGTIDRYVLVDVTSMGGATSLTFTVVIVSFGVTMRVS
jgi:hypothetical protein